jgi:glycosyltransferase involved in cell wall biosynthesis
MTPALKAELYRASDVLLLPNYGETVACFPEAYAFGVPVITTRIHHGGEFVRDGETGFLIDTPIYAFSEKLGREWPRAEDFLAELDQMRSRGALQPVVDQIVDRVETLIRDTSRTEPMRAAARQFYYDHFTPALRNERLRQLYSEVHGS